MKFEFQVKNLTKEDIGNFSADDVRRAVAIVITRNSAAPLRGVFLDRIISVGEKQDISLPPLMNPLAANEICGQLFHVDKRAGYALIEFSGVLETQEIRQAVDALIDAIAKVKGGGFFPGYRRIARETTIVVGRDIYSLQVVRGIRDARLTDNGEIIFIPKFPNKEEVRMISIKNPVELNDRISVGGSMGIYKAHEGQTLFCLDRIKDGKVRVVANTGIFIISPFVVGGIVAKEDSRQLSLPVLAYHELDEFVAVISGAEGDKLTLLPPADLQPTANC